MLLSASPGMKGKKPTTAPQRKSVMPSNSDVKGLGALLGSGNYLPQGGGMSGGGGRTKF